MNENTDKKPLTIDDVTTPEQRTLLTMRIFGASDEKLDKWAACCQQTLTNDLGTDPTVAIKYGWTLGLIRSTRVSRQMCRE